MPLHLQKPITYLITSGKTTPASVPTSDEIRDILRLVEVAADAKVDLIQLREKQLTARTLYELSVSAVRLLRGSDTRLLVNDRADIAQAAGAQGVHLTTRSLRPGVVRKMFGSDFLIGSSTHSVNEVVSAQAEGADFVVFGSVHETASKQAYGPAVGIEQLRLAAKCELPVLALGGVNLENAAECFAAGASGIAAIRLFSDLHSLTTNVTRIRSLFRRTNR